jgi:hypothetical protein
VSSPNEGERESEEERVKEKPLKRVSNPKEGGERE